MENRTIKFRGIDKTLKIWVYGNLIQGVDLDGNPLCQIEIADASEHRVYQVDPASVGQFTGLKDRAGKEIYEGDIVQIDEQGNYPSGTGFFQWLDWEEQGNWMKRKAGWGLVTDCKQIWTSESIVIVGNTSTTQKAG